MLGEDAVLLESTKRSQVTGSKHKKVTSGDKKRQQSSKKARGKQSGKYYRSTVVKMVDANFYERCVCTGQDCLVYYSR